jgi:hypothetical protein
VGGFVEAPSRILASRGGDFLIYAARPNDTRTQDRSRSTPERVCHPERSEGAASYGEELQSFAKEIATSPALKPFSGRGQTGLDVVSDYLGVKERRLCGPAKKSVLVPLPLARPSRASLLLTPSRSIRRHRTTNANFKLKLDSRRNEKENEIQKLAGG